MKTISIILLLLALAVNGWAATLVDENFDDQAYSTTMNICNRCNTDGGYDTDLIYTSTHARGGSGYCLAFDDALSGYQVFTLDDMTTALDAGVYFRYYLWFDDDYLFGTEMHGCTSSCAGCTDGTGLSDCYLDNKKMFKVAGSSGGTPDIEIIYRPCDSGLDVYCPQDTGHVERYFAYTGGLIKGQWNKIEIYIRVRSGSNALHIAINDHEVCDYVPGFQTPASGYDGTQQFISTRSSQIPPTGHGLWWVDDIFIASGDGDLVGSDEGESTPAPPTISNCTISNGRVQ